tara:strand:- start:88 stop:207 length:120 start_codon:yes stop_codon:yes gene_type:complete
VSLLEVGDIVTLITKEEHVDTLTMKLVLPKQVKLNDNGG